MARTKTKPQAGRVCFVSAEGRVAKVLGEADRSSEKRKRLRG